MRSIFWCVSTLLVVVAGCGGSNRPSLAPVSGTVTFRGAALEGAEVTFLPEQGRPARGTTDGEGHFELSTFAAQDGAAIGLHRVRITKTEKKDPQDDSPYAEQVNVIPEKYADPARSGLTAEVNATGDNRFKYELTD